MTMAEETKKQNLLVGSLCALGATAIWAGNYIIARRVNNRIAPVSLAFWRWLVAVFALSPFALKQFLMERKVVKRYALYLALTGALGVSAFNTLLYIASHTTSAINLSLISLTFPIFIVLLSWLFYGETLTLVKLGGIFLVVIGVLLLITRGNLTTLLTMKFNTGDIWMLTGALAWAIYSLLLKRKPHEMHPMTFQFSTFALGFLFLIPFTMWEITTTPSVNFDLSLILSILYIGVISSLLAYALWNKSVSMIGPTNAAMLFYTSPIFIGILAFFFLHEEIGLVHLYSALLIIPGILITNINKSQ